MPGAVNVLDGLVEVLVEVLPGSPKVHNTLTVSPTLGSAVPADEKLHTSNWQAGG